MGLGGGDEVAAPVGDGTAVLAPDDIGELFQGPLGVLQDIEVDFPAAVVAGG